MATKVLVLDFDGTMTDAEEEGAPFTQVYLEHVAYLTGLDFEEVEAIAVHMEADIAENPDIYGWTWADTQGNPVKVAPSSVDPYLRIKPIAEEIFHGLIPDQAMLQRLLQHLYKISYPHSGMTFRPGVKRLFKRLLDKPAYVVTNSHTGAVQEKLKKLGTNAEGVNILDAWHDQVIGLAMKYATNPDFNAVPIHLNIPCMDRPVLLRRHLYAEVLDELLERHNATWEELVVVGDIFELDLALPLAMGARVGLVVNSFTPVHETQYLAEHPRGDVLLGVNEIYDFAYKS